jgi:hypothetical protein
MGRFLVRSTWAVFARALCQFGLDFNQWDGYVHARGAFFHFLGHGGQFDARAVGLPWG